MYNIHDLTPHHQRAYSPRSNKFFSSLNNFTLFITCLYYKHVMKSVKFLKRRNKRKVV